MYIKSVTRITIHYLLTNNILEAYVNSQVSSKENLLCDIKLTLKGFVLFLPVDCAVDHLVVNIVDQDDLHTFKEINLNKYNQEEIRSIFSKFNYAVQFGFVDCIA